MPAELPTLGEIRAVFREELRAARDEFRTAVADLVNPKQPSDVLTVEEAAGIAKVQPVTIRDWVRRGHLKASKPGGGHHYRIARVDLCRCLETSRAAEQDVDDVADRILSAPSGRMRRSRVGSDGKDR